MNQIITQKSASPLGMLEKFYILAMNTKMYLLVGRMLHLMLVAGVFMFFYFGDMAIRSFMSNEYIWGSLYTYLSLYGFTLPFFSQLDARSRFQNYKLAKDKIHEYGFQERILKPFVYSRCQREAVLMAAKSLGKEKECTSMFRKMGFKWYHILPRILIQNPSFIITKKYWSITLFAAQYKSRYFLW